MTGLQPLHEVQARVLAPLSAGPSVTVDLIDAVGLVTASPVTAAEAVPPFANSAMDGYAVRAADCAFASEDVPVRLRVVGELPAGTAPTIPVGPGEAIRIMTGAPVPDGADAVVMVEDTERDGDAVLVHRAGGKHIREAGGDFRAGDEVFPPATEIRPAHVGVLASMGLAEVTVVRRPRVGVLSTGDELVGPGEPLAPGKIRESNRPMLLALVEQAACEPVDLGVVPDDETTVRQALADGLDTCDALITSGGVSVGDYDVVRAVLGDVADMEWFQVAIKPAKPFAFGEARVGGDVRPIFGLPGNPVSSFVSFELFARPALRRMMGHHRLFRPVVRARAAEPFPRHLDGKTHFDRVRVMVEGGRWTVARSGEQQSNVLTAMARADGLAILRDGPGVAAGEEVEVMLLDLPGGATGPTP